MSQYKVIFIEALDCNIEPDNDLGKLKKKYVAFNSFTAAPAQIEKLKEAKNFQPQELANLLESAESLFVCQTNSNNFKQALDTIVEACNRNSFLVIAAKNALVFAGTAANKENNNQSRPCTSQNIIPTLCYAFGFAIPENTDGAVLYQAFKDPDFPHSEIKRLNESILSMEAAMERGSRMPWDKHDCA